MAELIKLGPLSAKLGESTRQIQRIVDEGLAPAPAAKGQYDAWAVARGMIRYYKDKSSKVSEARTIDAARSARAQADMAEMERGKMQRTLCSRDDYRNNYADAVAQGVRNIMRIKDIPKTVKAFREVVFAAIRDVKLPEPSEEK